MLQILVSCKHTTVITPNTDTEFTPIYAIDVFWLKSFWIPIHQTKLLKTYKARDRANQHNSIHMQKRNRTLDQWYEEELNTQVMGAIWESWITVALGQIPARYLVKAWLFYMWTLREVIQWLKIRGHCSHGCWQSTLRRNDPWVVGNNRFVELLWKGG